ncbi:type IV toxin-antitoxin system AbiEi family antitoxin domain-containing protein [Nocardioides sp. SYSU D00065]|uniref:type IV toxin-antitoxin system AbiEi family antitoxin domain-containing protein n=1 Tax=Nocardioides sp. SYSU D00065 TaxID=2817378 RepID=UPI001B32E83B|nr:type IV toxin-antitoxin system AbiEi family antitoxin domain-containing protein [Nocardioides sp. SYSU D00065]
MDPVAALARLGGIASTAQVLSLTTRKRLRRAVDEGRVVRVSRGRYALPTADEAKAVAREVGGHLRLLCAAAHWGWETKWPARHPQVVAPRRPRAPVRAEVAYGWLPPRDRDGWATSPRRTVLDCAAELPFDEALAVADSALRHGDLDHDDLLATLRPDTPAHVRRVLEHATALAANPFESVLRAVLVDAGIDVVPQWATAIGGVTYHPDLADPFRALAIEANSWAFHAGRSEHDADCVRYNALVVAGWTVLRFTWEQVMFAPHVVVRTVRAAMSLPVAA